MMSQLDFLSEFGVNTFTLTQARVQELAEIISALQRNASPVNTVRKRLRLAGLAAREIDCVAIRLRSQA